MIQGTHLAKVGHHWMDSIAHQHNISISPGSEQFRRTIVQISLFHRIRRSRIKDSHNLIGPALVQGLDVIHQVLLGIGLLIANRTTPARRCALGSRRKRKEGIPLNTTVTNIRRNEVALRSNVDL